MNLFFNRWFIINFMELAKLDKMFQAALLHNLGLMARGGQSQLARAIGVTPQAIDAMKIGKNAGSEATRRKIAKFFNYPRYEDFLEFGYALLTGKPAPDLTPHTLTDSELADRSFLTVPFSTTMKLAAGNGGTTLNYIDVDEDADSSTIIIHGPTLGVHNANHLQAFRVDGDSMEPLIAQGGIVLVDKTVTRLDDDRFREGGIYMLCWEDDGLCAVKRLRWAELGKLVAIESANPNTPTIFKKTKEIHQLIGKIIWSWREHE